MSRVILDLCGGTGSWSKPWKDNGYEVIVMTTPTYDVTKWKEYPKIVELIKSNQIYGILAAPPCTMFSIARNDKTAIKPRDLRGGMKIVNACLEIIHECLYVQHKLSSPGLKFWALENPYGGYLKRFLGKPSLVFHPYEYGDPYTKRTALWGEFKELKKNPVKPREFEHPTTKGAKDFVSCVEHFADLKDIPNGYKELTGLNNRTIMRSMTPQGFAKAFFEANKNKSLPCTNEKTEMYRVSSPNLNSKNDSQQHSHSQTEELQLVSDMDGEGSEEPTPPVDTSQLLNKTNEGKNGS